jgi:hypothetical protein
MHTGLHAIGWGLPRLAIVLCLAVVATPIAYSILVFILVLVQAVAAFGQERPRGARSSN